MSMNSSVSKNRVGVRFHPNDKEIINYFLHHKINGRDYLVDLDVREIDLLRCHPKDIPGFLRTSSSSGGDDDDQLWYFFNRLDFKNSKSKRANRKSERGFWKCTGKVRVIKVRGEEIGAKRTLVYYEDGPGLKPIKTNWIIHEFQAKTTIPPPEINFVLCRLKNEAYEKSSTTDHDNGMVPILATFPNSDSENEEITKDLEHILFEEQLLVTTCSDYQNVASNFRYDCKDDDDVDQMPLADSFLDLDDLLFEEYAEIN